MRKAFLLLSETQMWCCNWILSNRFGGRCAQRNGASFSGGPAQQLAWKGLEHKLELMNFLNVIPLLTLYDVW